MSHIKCKKWQCRMSLSLKNPHVPCQMYEMALSDGLRKQGRAGGKSGLTPEEGGWEGREVLAIPDRGSCKTFEPFRKSVCVGGGGGGVMIATLVTLF